LLPTHIAPPPQSANLPQPPPLSCSSSHTCLSNHSAAGSACKSVLPSHQHATSAGVKTISGSFSTLPYLATDNATADSTSVVSPISANSPLFAVDYLSASSVGLNLMVDFSFYPLQQDTSLPPSSHVLPPLISKHLMVLRPQQPKTANLVASTAVVTASPRVLHFLFSKPLVFSDTDKYIVWHDAMCDEIKALHSNHTWSLVPFHPLMNVIGSRWVYQIKRRIDGSIEHYKASLVTKGFTQQ